MSNSSIHEFTKSICTFQRKSGEAGPSSAAGPSQVCASPSSDAGLLPFGLLRATPPRPLFSRTLLTYTIPNAQLDGIEFGNPVMMDRQKWAMDLATLASQLPPGAHGDDVYSSHPNDTTGTWRGDAAVIAQIDAVAERAAAKKWVGGRGGD